MFVVAVVAITCRAVKKPRLAGGVPVLRKSVYLSDRCHVACLQTFRTLLNVEADALPFSKGLESIAGNC